MISKSELTKQIALGRVHEVFTHSTEGEFDVTLMRLVAQRGEYEKFSADLTPDLVKNIMLTRDWEIERVVNMSVKEAVEPTLWILSTDEKHILLDGTHRLIKLGACGVSKFHGYLARWDQAIRPNMDLFVQTSLHQWGKYEVRDGKLYDRETGVEFKGLEAKDV